MSKTRKVVVVQGGADAFAQNSIYISGKKLIKIRSVEVKVVLGAAWAATHQVEIAIASFTQGSMPTPNSNAIQWYKEVTQVGAPASMVDISWRTSNLPAFVSEGIFCLLDTDNTGAVNTAYFTITYDEYKA